MAYLYTLTEGVDKYFITEGIDKKKHFGRYLTIGGDIWADLYMNTLNVTKNVWQTIKQDSDGNYIDIPNDCERIFYVSTQDKCNNAVPLYFNALFNTLHKPAKKSCGCQSCDCSGLCNELSNTTMTTKVMFTQNGIDYSEKKWITVCPNGDIIEYREVPVKKFNDRVGDAGDYNEDYNNDYLIANPFANYTIVTQTFQEKICKLEVRPCGCPVSTVENENLVLAHCGGYLNPLLRCSKKRCETFLPEVNAKHIGEVSISECGTRIYVRWLKKETDFLLLTYQTNGRCERSQNAIPEKGLMALWTGIDFRKKMFNNYFSFNDKEAARIAYEREKNNLIGFDNKLSFQFLSDLSDTPIKW